MKKFIYIILLLAMAGAGISGLLVIDHYHPAVRERIVACGGGMIDPCGVVNQSDYSEVFGVPLASLGVSLYLLIIFIALTADFAAGGYYALAAMLLLLLSSAAVIADIALAVILIILGYFCWLCAATYAVNIGILVCAVFLYRTSMADGGHNFFGAIKNAHYELRASSHARAAAALFVCFSFFLLFTVILSTGIMKSQAGPQPDAEQVRSFLKEHYATPVENLDLPESPMVLGDERAKVTIVAFTDCLCAACSQFYLTEKYLLTRYPGRLKIAHYAFPLDKECNPHAKRTTYPRSCVASKAMFAAADMGIWKDYYVRHFSSLGRMRRDYSERGAIIAARGIADEDGFAEAMRSIETVDALDRQIQIGGALKISATPTLFIGGRRIVGVPPKEMLCALIDTQLAASR